MGSADDYGDASESGGVGVTTKKSISWGETPKKVSWFANAKKYIGHAGLPIGLIIYTALGAWVRCHFCSKSLLSTTPHL